ncbi:MAG: ParB N-terminal domain-containing protein [Alphaproteobacteria bacterium]|nr:ParB N-terminal domain-containing protein [Alphaproteobacteria bacterium]
MSDNSECFPIEKIHVPVKRKKTLKPELVHQLAESILEIGQQTPVLIRSDGDQFVLVEGLHRLEACKALGEDNILATLVSAEYAQHRAVLSDSAEVEAEREKMGRLKRLRLEKEAAEKALAAAHEEPRPSPPAQPPGPVILPEPQAAPAQKDHHDRPAAIKPMKPIKEPPARSAKATRKSEPARPKTLSAWIEQQKRDGSRY